MTIFLFSCQDYLDIVPDNVPVLDHAFRSRTTAMNYLATCYNYIPNIGHPNNDPAMSASDEWFVEVNDFYRSEFTGLEYRFGFASADRPLFDYWGNPSGTAGKSMYKAIRDCNIFLDNIHKVTSDLTDGEKKVWIAEVKVLKAYYHFYLMRLYGPIPVIRENLSVDISIEETRVFREPINNVVEYIVSLLDEAAPNLPPEILSRSVDLGHISRPVALMIKADVLVTAASPFFNGNSDMDILVNPDGTKLFPEFDANRWSLAATACEEAIIACTDIGRDFYEFEEYNDISDTTKLVLSLKQVATELWNNEIIWTSTNASSAELAGATTPYFHQDMHKFAPFNPYMSPTLKSAEFFYSKNGVPMDEDVDYPNNNKYDVVLVPDDHLYYAEPGYETLQLNIDREPRYYANIAFDGARWFGNGRYKEIGRGSNRDEESYVFNLKEGGQQGKNGSLRFSPTGFWAKKTSHIESNYPNSNSRYYELSSFPIYRMSDLYLLYAEALNESLSSPNQQVYDAIDKVRIKSGLKGVAESWQNHSRFPAKVNSKEGMREIIHYERTNELAFEGKRFYDIRRWKTASSDMNEPIKGMNVNEETTEGFNKIIPYAIQLFTNKNYLMPIKNDELRVNKNLVQNPYW